MGMGDEGRSRGRVMILVRMERKDEEREQVQEW